MNPYARGLRLLLLAAVMPATVSPAYTVSKTTTGVEIKWSVREVGFHANTNAGPAGVLAPMQAAMVTWSTNTGASFRFSHRGATTRSGSSLDYTNVLSFGDLGSGGTIARNSFWFNGITGQLIDSDVVFNTYYPWSISGEPGKMDVHNIAAHELGHALSLSDLSGGGDADKTLYAWSSSGETKKRSLAPDDIAGLAHLYPPVIVTVTFNGQGGSTPVPTAITVTNAAPYGTLASTTRTGYTFGGWWTGAGGSGTPVTAASNVTVTTAQTLYAKWSVNSYTVTFDAQGGTTPVPSSINVTYGSPYGTLATTTRTGHAFGGWWTGAGGSGTPVTAASNVTVTTAQTLYAQWVLLLTTQGTPYPWLDQYNLVEGGNYEAAALADVDADGHAAWQEYVTGSVPTNRHSVFRTLMLTVSNGRPRVAWSPDLATTRVYTVAGKTNLCNSAWGATNSGSRFFQVSVAFP